VGQVGAGTRRHDQPGVQNAVGEGSEFGGSLFLLRIQNFAPMGTVARWEVEHSATEAQRPRTKAKVSSDNIKLSRSDLVPCRS
jgi:hypothetical protein